MSRRDWLLLLLAFEGAPDGLHPVRVQTSMFLLAEDPGFDLPAGEGYEFVPYNYGPMSKDVYADLDELEADALIRGVQAQGQGWTLLRATPKGLEAAQGLVDGMVAPDIPVARRLFEIKRMVARMTFTELVDYVYERFPDYQSRSLFRRQLIH